MSHMHFTIYTNKNKKLKEGKIKKGKRGEI
jgi:hypothetical protein